MEANLRITRVKEALFYLAGSSASLHLMRAGLEHAQLHSLPVMTPASHYTSAKCFSLYQLASPSLDLLSFMLYTYIFKSSFAQFNIMGLIYHWALILTQVHKSLYPSSQEWSLSSAAHLSEPDLPVIGHWSACTGLSLGKMSSLAPISCDSSRCYKI